MWLLWISVVLFVIWIVDWAVLQAVTASFWILLAFAVAFLVVHLVVRSNWKRPPEQLTRPPARTTTGSFASQLWRHRNV
jgi:hypothetical protein